MPSHWLCTAIVQVRGSENNQSRALTQNVQSAAQCVFSHWAPGLKNKNDNKLKGDVQHGTCYKQTRTAHGYNNARFEVAGLCAHLKERKQKSDNLCGDIGVG